MNRTTSLLVIGTALCLAAAWQYSGPAGAATPAPVSAKKVQWDYAELSVRYADLTTSEKPEHQRVQFSSRELNVNEVGWTTFARKMGIPAEDGNRQLVFDYLGSQGWELVAATTTTIPRKVDQTGVAFYWHFKRERR